MQFQSLKLGGAGLTFASTSTTRLPFQFPNPIQSAYAILQRTRFARTRAPHTYYESSNEELSVQEISVLPLFDGLQSKTSGEIQIQFSVHDDTTPSSAELIQAEIEVLVIGV
jgi:hypothetical protein